MTVGNVDVVDVMEDVLGMGNKKEEERAAGTTDPSAHSPLKDSGHLQALPQDKPDCFTGTVTISDIHELEV